MEYKEITLNETSLKNLGNIKELGELHFHSLCGAAFTTYGNILIFLTYLYEKKTN